MNSRKMFLDLRATKHSVYARPGLLGTLAQLAMAAALCALVLAAASCTNGNAVETSAESAEDLAQYTVRINPVLNGSLIIEPRLEGGTAYPAGTVFHVSAEADSRYRLDSLYVETAGPFGPAYSESMVPEMTITVDQNLSIGAAFISERELAGFSVIQDVVYAQPGVKPLKYDVFIPEDAQDLPLIVIVHGGGWATNDENIMRGMAREMVRTGKYVVASIDYRWIGRRDGDQSPNQVYQLIEDVFGALAHIQEHAREYGADPSRIAITGDSAGGHLASSAATMLERIGDGGFGNGTYEYQPTYLPAGLSTAELRDRLSSAIRVVAPSYGVFYGDFIRESAGSEDAYRALAPLENIPASSARAVPHYLVRGTSDPLISFEMLARYAEALRAAGQTVDHVEVEGAGHAFFDWKPDATTRRTFNRYGVPYIADMLEFVDRYL